VSPLFRRSEEKAARRAAAKEEIERLRALSVDELAAKILPGLGPDGPTHGNSVYVQQLCLYLLADFPGAGRMDPLDLRPAVRRSLERLENAGLVTTISVQREPLWRLTPLGESTLAEGTLPERLR
jgi:DNA-binding transcriptional ArsR family regulator